MSRILAALPLVMLLGLTSLSCPLHGQTDWTIKAQVGVVRLTQKSFGLGTRYSLPDKQVAGGLTASRGITNALTMIISYQYLSTELATFEFKHEPPEAPTHSATLASTGLRAHFATLAMSTPLIHDRQSGRTLLASLGAGLAFFDPGRNRAEANPAIEGDFPVDLEVLVDPLVTGGLTFRVPLSQRTSFDLDLDYILQFCSRGDSIEARYLCSRDGLLDHVGLKAGLDVQLP